MKKHIKNQGLSFSKNSLVELNDSQLSITNSGSSSFCATIAVYIAKEFINGIRDAGNH